MTAYPDLSEAGRGNVLIDDRGRVMRFPLRRDYMELLRSKGLISDEYDFQCNPLLVEAVYLDWLRRAQVGCVFAQLLGRPRNRKNMRTAILGKQIIRDGMADLASEIDSVIQSSVDDPEIEAVSIILPAIVDPEDLVRLTFSLSKLPLWDLEREWLWRKTMTVIGLRRQIENIVWAETLGIGPFQFFPPTRQCPVTSLEVRTKSNRSIWSKLHKLRTRRAAHLAQVPTDHFLTPKQNQVRFKKWTPALRSRILGGESDARAKAGVTFTVPAAIWSQIKSEQ